MRNVMYVAAKELRSYFVSPLAYGVMALWLVMTGFFFALSVSGSQEASLNGVFGVVTILLIFIPPLLTMRLLAEESRMGTLELLLTAPIKDWAVVLGKFVAVVVLYLVMLALTIFYPILLVVFKGNPDWGPILSGYIGLFLLGSVFLGIGLFASALTSSQILAAIYAMGMGLLLFVIGNLGQILGAGFGDFLQKISVSNRFDPFARGVVDLKDVVFFVSFAALLLFLTVQVVEARRYRS